MEENDQVITNTEQLDSLFKVFNAAIKRSLVYSPSHPMCAEARAQLYTLIKEYMETSEQLKFGITRESIIVEGNEYGMDAGSFYMALAAHLHDRQLTSITIYKPVQNFELDALLDALAQDPNELRKSGGLEEALDMKQVKNITAKRLEVEAAEEAGDLAFDEEDGDFIASEEMFMLLGETALSDNERDKITLRLRKSPLDTAKLLVKLSDMAATTEGDPSLEGRASYLAGAIETLATMAAEQGDDVKQEIFRNIAESLNTLSDEFKSPILDILQERFGSLDFGPELMEAMNLALKLVGEQTVGYQESGAPAPTGETEELRLSPEEVYFEFAHFYDDLPQQVEQTVEEEIASLEIEDVDQQAIETLVDMLINCEDEPRLTKTLDSLQANVIEMLQNGRLELAAKSIKAMRLKGQELQRTSPELVCLPRNTLLNIAEADNLHIILTAALDSDNDDDKRFGRAMLDMLGAGAVPGLLVMAAREPSGERRLKLCKIAAHAGEGALAIFERRLSEEDEGIVRAVVVAMAQLDDPKATDILKRALRHESNAVRVEALRAMSSSRGSAGVSFVIVALDDPSPDVQNVAYSEIGRLKAAGAIPRLSEKAAETDFLSRNIDTRLKAIRVLGEIGSEQALPVLDKLASKRFALRKQTKMLKEAAVQAIENIESKQET